MIKNIGFFEKVFKKFSNLKTIENNNPGPGHYQLKPLIDGSGVTFVSRFKSSTAKSLGGRLRELSNKNPSKSIFPKQFKIKIQII